MKATAERFNEINFSKESEGGWFTDKVCDKIKAFIENEKEIARKEERERIIEIALMLNKKHPQDSLNLCDLISQIEKEDIK